MKAIILILFLSKLLLPAFAQNHISGFITDRTTGEALPGASVLVRESGSGTVTDSVGHFSLDVRTVPVTLEISFVGYSSRRVAATGSAELRIGLESDYRLEEVVIRAIRGTGNTPVTESTLDKKDIDREFIGQDPLFLMKDLTPSIIAYSESGTNLSNYGQMRLRGIDQSRINITLDGAPLNDMIDQGVFFSNFIDFGNSVESIQIQRGVGTSTNGTASYAGSINFQSPDLINSQAGGTVQLMGGAFNTKRASGEVKTGILDHDLAFYSRFSKLNSDGYRYHTSTDSYSFFFSGGYFGKRDMVKITGFTGRSKNGLAYLPVAISDIRQDPRTNYVNENDRDNFGQDFLQIQYTRSFSDRFTWVNSLYHGAAGGDFPSGYFETDSIYNSGATGNYNLRSRFTQINYPLFNRHWGVMSYLDASSGNGLFNIHAGIHAYTFRRHDLESVIPDDAHPFYNEHSDKKEISSFVKADYLLGRLMFYGDLQFRVPRLRIEPDENLLPGEQDVIKSWHFLNPKLGASFRIGDRQNIYVFYGYNGREPTKIDILGGYQLTPLNLASVRSNDVNPEYVHDVETGYRFNTPVLYGQLNAFYMKFRNEIAPIGEYVPEGFIQLRKNVPSSFRTGIELDWSWKITSSFMFKGNSTYMKSRIRTYDPDEDPAVYTDVTQALSPELMGFGSLTYTFQDRLEIEISGKYMSYSYLEPTNQENMRMPGFFVMGSRITVKFLKNQTFGIYLNNLSDTRYYTYGAPVDPDYDGISEPGYFVQPPRNIYAMLTLNF